jgi:crossover junction endodeoxyribonuclease RuvC
MELLRYFPTFHSYTPLQVKKALTGNGRARKEQVEIVVRQLLGLKKEIRPLDISDALAVAITHSYSLLSPVNSN